MQVSYARWTQVLVSWLLICTYELCRLLFHWPGNEQGIFGESATAMSHHDGQDVREESLAGEGAAARVHPAVLQTGLRIADGTIRGGNARCVAMLATLRLLIQVLARLRAGDSFACCACMLLEAYLRAVVLLDIQCHRFQLGILVMFA